MSELFQKANIGKMELRNRFVRAATWEGMAGENGEVTEPLMGIYRELAKGGVGLILTGYAYVSKRGKANPGMLGAYDDSLISGLKRLADAVHKENGKVALQIAHGGSQIQIHTDTPSEAPFAIRERTTGNTPVEMTVQDIQRVIGEFAQAARRAKEAGFDGIQIHAAHGFLLSQFLSPYSNRRTDKYGGHIENRARIIFEIYDAIRRNVGNDYPVLIKINASDFDDGVGLTPEDSLWVCRKLSDMGIDAIELSGGILASGEFIPSRSAINSPDKEAYFKEYARQFRPHLKCPLILVGGLRSLGVMEAMYREGLVQFFSLSRPFISEPHLIKRWQSGNKERARCISCNKCFMTASREGRLYCVSFKSPL
ncbi:MAG: NADH:flavin oxidoreductase [Candidatus Brocadia sp.]|nr:NADH:flavin oxidoreductase [Candidatus Brocadia sp.]